MACSHRSSGPPERVQTAAEVCGTLPSSPESRSGQSEGHRVRCSAARTPFRTRTYRTSLLSCSRRAAFRSRIPHHPVWHAPTCSRTARTRTCVREHRRAAAGCRTSPGAGPSGSAIVHCSRFPGCRCSPASCSSSGTAELRGATSRGPARRVRRKERGSSPTTGGSTGDSPSGSSRKAESTCATRCFRKSGLRNASSGRARSGPPSCVRTRATSSFYALRTAFSGRSSSTPWLFAPARCARPGSPAVSGTIWWCPAQSWAGRSCDAGTTTRRHGVFHWFIRATTCTGTTCTRTPRAAGSLCTLWGSTSRRRGSATSTSRAVEHGTACLHGGGNRDGRLSQTARPVRQCDR